MEDTCGDRTAVCHEHVTDKLFSVAGRSHCAMTEAFSERLSPEESVSKPAKCHNPDTAPQKSSKVKKREDKGIGKFKVSHYLSCFLSMCILFIVLCFLYYIYGYK